MRASYQTNEKVDIELSDEEIALLIKSLEAVSKVIENWEFEILIGFPQNAYVLIEKLKKSMNDK